MTQLPRLGLLQNRVKSIARGNLLQAVTLLRKQKVPASFAFEAYLLGLAHTDPIDGLIGPTRQRLVHRGIEVLRHPGNPCRFSILVQVVFGKVMRLSQEAESGGPLLRSATRKGTGRLPRRSSTHASQPLLGFPQQAL
jgi:hypothetical protein